MSVKSKIEAHNTLLQTIFVSGALSSLQSIRSNDLYWSLVVAQKCLQDIPRFRRTNTRGTEPRLKSKECPWSFWLTLQGHSNKLLVMHPTWSFLLFKLWSCPLNALCISVKKITVWERYNCSIVSVLNGNKQACQVVDTGNTVQFVSLLSLLNLCKGL